MFTDVMVDLETLGQTPGCALVSIGAVAFNGAKLGPEFYQVVGRQSCLDAGLFEEEATLVWWKTQPLEAALAFDQSVNDGRQSIALKVSLEQFRTFLGAFGPNVRVWGNGADFDNAILACAHRAAGLKLPWQFWNNRCYRTVKNLNPRVKLDRTGVYHNALDDAKSQARHMLELKKAGVW